ncbi:MAG: DUF424 domain-containing protein [Halobacteriota archaeon]
MSMYLKSYKVNRETIVAVCDSELLGRTFCDGELHLSVNEEFFKGLLASEHDVREALQSATIANLVGKRAVDCGIDSGIIDNDYIITIEGVPHAQMVML